MMAEVGSSRTASNSDESSETTKQNRAEAAHDAQRTRKSAKCARQGLVAPCLTSTLSQLRLARNQAPADQPPDAVQTDEQQELAEEEQRHVEACTSRPSGDRQTHERRRVSQRRSQQTMLDCRARVQKTRCSNESAPVIRRCAGVSAITQVPPLLSRMLKSEAQTKQGQR